MALRSSLQMNFYFFYLPVINSYLNRHDLLEEILCRSHRRMFGPPGLVPDKNAQRKYDLFYSSRIESVEEKNPGDVFNWRRW